MKFGEEDPLFARVFLESQNWSELIGCHNLAELNHAIDTGKIYDFIAIAEALHEKGWLNWQIRSASRNPIYGSCA